MRFCVWGDISYLLHEAEMRRLQPLDNEPTTWITSTASNSMVLDESLAKLKCEISQDFGTVRLVGGESLVSQRTAFSKDSKYVFICL